MDLILIGYLAFLGIIFAITSILTKKLTIGVMVLLIFVIIGYILTILPIVAIILSAMSLVGLIAYYLFMRNENRYGM